MRHKLIIIAGPTAVGKTAEAIRLATALQTEIVSCDSRQFYSELNIGVARPSDAELAAVPHHFIASRSVRQPYNVFDYEHDAIACIMSLFERHQVVVAVGGSGLYVDALIRGVSAMPDPTPELRAELSAMSLDEKRQLLLRLDPAYHSRVDLRNPIRIQRALEVTITAGRPYSTIVAEYKPAVRPFDIEVRLVRTDAATLRQRINSRVDLMLRSGLMDEVAALAPLRALPPLQTIGYRELFPVLDGLDTFDHATEMIKLNTWHYAKKQLTWFRNDRYTS